MFSHKYDCLRYIAALGAGTLVAIFCPTKTLIVLLALVIVILGLTVPKF